MGKGLLIIVIGGMMAATTLSFQAKQTALETTKVQTEYQEEILAREIARSAYSVAFRLAQTAGNDVDQALANVNGTTTAGNPDRDGEMLGNYQGGDFAVQAYSVDGQNVKIRSIGNFGEATHTINENYTVQLLTVKQQSRVTIEFLQSMAGYCSAIFLQQFVPNTGQATPAGAALTDDARYFTMQPEMVFDAGHNRAQSESRNTPQDIILEPGTRMNFFIGVDKDCSEEGLWEESFVAETYDWVHNALEEDVENLDDLQEGLYSMIEQNEVNDQTWRIAFEDLRNFGQAKHEDIKANSYGGNWNDAAQTYGGSGWTEKDARGYRKLRDFGWKPDFSDQVIEITLTPCGGLCEPPV
ncbi:MAG: hypothetical protein BMS9Abin05_2567 [Rhodothermia bacterium]|nr:MAG: hypothetical protein BMS9Abin05_2567 [Rhodothermia bacterium]